MRIRLGLWQRRAARRSAIWLMLAVTIFWSAIGPLAANACDTPVYRYAMYQWRPAPYEVYSFRRGEPSESLQAADRALDRLAADPRTGANLALIEVNLDEDPELRRVPPDVRQHWQAKTAAGDESPHHLIVSPLGALVHAGPLAESDVTALVESPARLAIAERLASGHACVLVLLSGVIPADASAEPSDGAKELQDNIEPAAVTRKEVVREEDGAATDAAEAQVKQLVDDIAAGKIELYSAPSKGKLFGPGAPPVESDDADSQAVSPPSRDAGENPPDASDDASPSHEISYVRVSRTDPKESWLVRTLLTVEPDLSELDPPMVFAVFGRGRVLPPYIGDGIEANNLLDVVEYVTGACSCTVKEQNPGLDLLVRQDWEAVAAKVAERFGAEEGNEQHFGSDQLFPQLLIPDVTGEAADNLRADASDAANPTGSDSGDSDSGEPTSADQGLSRAVDGAMRESSGSADVAGAGEHFADGVGESHASDSDETSVAHADAPTASAAAGTAVTSRLLTRTFPLSWIAMLGGALALGVIFLALVTAIVVGLKPRQRRES